MKQVAKVFESKYLSKIINNIDYGNKDKNPDNPDMSKESDESVNLTPNSVSR